MQARVARNVLQTFDNHQLTEVSTAWWFRYGSTNASGYSTTEHSLFPKYPRIRLGCFHQFIMRADGGDLAFAQHDDQICPADLRQAMRDDKGRPPAGRVGDGALDLVLGRRVDRGGGIIQDQNVRIGQEGACQGDALALSAGERDAAFADDGCIALVKGLDEIIRLRRLRRRLRSPPVLLPASQRRYCR